MALIDYAGMVSPAPYIGSKQLFVTFFHLLVGGRAKKWHTCPSGSSAWCRREGLLIRKNVQERRFADKKERAGEKVC